MRARKSKARSTNSLQTVGVTMQSEGISFLSQFYICICSCLVCVFFVFIRPLGVFFYIVLSLPCAPTSSSGGVVLCPTLCADGRGPPPPSVLDRDDMPSMSCLVYRVTCIFHGSIVYMGKHMVKYFQKFVHDMLEWI